MSPFICVKEMYYEAYNYHVAHRVVDHVGVFCLRYFYDYIFLFSEQIF